MEADEIVKLICHRLPTENEVRVSAIMKRQSPHATEQSRPSSMKASGTATPQVGIEIQDPPRSSATTRMQSSSNPRPTFSAQTRPSSAAQSVGPHDTDVSEHCTSLSLIHI